MRFELADCENVILREIEDPEMKRLDVAKTYCLILRSSEAKMVDWSKINNAIVARWSNTALDWIKNKAFTGKCFDI